MQFEIGQIVEASFGWSAESNFGRYLVLELGSFADQAYFQVLRPLPYSDEEVGDKHQTTAQELFPDLY
jgi:hypothetical protein